MKKKSESEAQPLSSAPHSQLGPTPGFRTVPKTGVIYVTTEAQKRGFQAPGAAQDWVNLGQGMPECGPLMGAPDRIHSVVLDDLVHEYSPVSGIFELRDAVAKMYNRRFRKGLRSQYTAENVSISPGGRSALTRLAAALGSVHLGHFLPDYTAYEELLDIFKAFTPIPIALDADRGYQISTDELRKEIQGRGLSALLLSNPRNPTGQTLQGTELKDWVQISRELECSLILDEFYSHYLWGAQPQMISAAAHVQDVNQDPVILLDGLTKNWRYAGWRIAWTVGPRSVIEAVSSAASFLDGGASRPLQKAALPLLEDAVIDAELKAIHQTFGMKRDKMLERCKKMGMKISSEPQGTFYLFADLSELPESLRSGMDFFQAALEEKVICVPGEFFDVNPGKRRRPHASRFHCFVRLSFGPSWDQISIGLDRLESLIARHRKGNATHEV